MSGTPELDPIVFGPEHQARIDEDVAKRDALRKLTAEETIMDARASARRIAAGLGGLGDPTVMGDLCERCQERNALPADKASCAHKAICEDCYPRGCDYCERRHYEGIQHREETANRILKAGMDLRVAADDLAETDMDLLDYRTRADVLRQMDSTLESIRRIYDHLNAQGR